MKKASKAFIFDFDQTLAVTDCMVYVMKEGKKLRQKKLSTAEFNTYKLAYDESFDFREFRSDKFITNANPTKLMELAKQVYDEGHSVYVLTARDDDVSTAIASWMIGNGVKPIRVFCVGGRRDRIAKEKAKVLETLKQIFDVVYFYDDCQDNIDMAQKVGVKCYLV